MLDVIDRVMRNCSGGVRFLQSHALIEHANKSECAKHSVIVSSVEDTKLIIASLLSIEPTKTTKTTNRYIILDITGLQPVHFHPLLAELHHARKQSYICFIMGAEYLSVGTRLDGWLFPDPSWYHIAGHQHVLVSWATALNIETQTLHLLIHAMNEQFDCTLMENQFITLWNKEGVQKKRVFLKQMETMETMETMKTTGENESKSLPDKVFERQCDHKDDVPSTPSSSDEKEKQQATDSRSYSSPNGSSETEHESDDWLTDAIDHREPSMIKVPAQPEGSDEKQGEEEHKNEEAKTAKTRRVSRCQQIFLRCFGTRH